MSVATYFKYDTSHLSTNERETIKILEKVGEWIHKIWRKQVDVKTGSTSFYPSDLSKEELMSAAKKNPQLLSPYTVVKRMKDRSLSAVPYVVEYKRAHENICVLLEQAIKTTDDKNLAKYLYQMKEYFKRGEFTKSMELFLKSPNTKIDILMGPIESYNDNFMGVKRSYQFSLRVMRENETESVSKMLSIVKKLGILKPSGSVAAKLKSDAIKFRVDDVLMFAGRQAGSMPSSTNLPNEPELVQKYGVKVIVYHNSLIKKFSTQLKPLLKTVKNFDIARRKDAMSDANYRLIVLHEIAEGTVKYIGMEKRLGEYFDIVRELNADIFGVRSAKYHVLNGLISVEEYNELLVAFLIFAINVCHRADKQSSIMVYAKGFYMIFNYLEKLSAITLKANTIKIDAEKLSTGLDVFSDTILSIMAKGNSDDVALLMKKWGKSDIVERLPKATK